MITQTSDNKVRQCVILLSPLGIIAIGHLVARFAVIYLGVWAWLPLQLTLWSMFAWLIAWGGGRESIQRWLLPPHGAWGWSALAVLVGTIPLQLFLQNWKLFDSIGLVLLSLLLIVINPFLEEGYWRGLLLDQSKAWPGWLSILYSSFFFAVDHPLTFGVFSIANRHPITTISTFIMGVVWAIVYKKTGSLRWLIFSHLLVDLFNLSILALLNVFVPSGLP